MKKRYLFKAIAFAAATIAAGSSMAQSGNFKVGLITPLTGQQATTGKQMEAGARAYMAMNGDTVNGRKIELIVKDDGGIPDASKRIAQELVVNDKVNVLAGMGLTPIALAIAPVSGLEGHTLRQLWNVVLGTTVELADGYANGGVAGRIYEFIGNAKGTFEAVARGIPRQERCDDHGRPCSYGR